MNAFIRFLLGLPARLEDVEELRRAIPELFEEHAREEDPHAAPSTERIRIDELVVVMRAQPRSSLLDALRAWVREKEAEQRAEQMKRTPDGASRTGSSRGCPLGRAECPLHVDAEGGGSADQVSPESPFDDDDDDDDDEERGLRHLIVGGGARRGSKEFLNLVTQIRAKNCAPEEIRTVILTDRYIHDSLGEGGDGGGFAMLLSYFEALGLKRESRFAVEFSPAMRGATPEKIANFETRLGTHYTNAIVRRHHGQAMFHDRLFLVHDSKGQVHGLFGPSLNGLDGASLYVMGELDEPAIKRLRAALNL